VSRNSGALTVDQGIREITARREKRETEKERKKEREGEGEQYTPYSFLKIKKSTGRAN